MSKKKTSNTGCVYISKLKPGAYKKKPLNKNVKFLMEKISKILWKFKSEKLITLLI